MWIQLSLLVLELIYIPVASHNEHKVILENDEIFGSCRNPSSGVVDIHGFLDITNYKMTQTADGVVLEGNSTFVWDIEPGDRIQAYFTVLRFDRGSWLPTPLALRVVDICPILFDEKQYWYKIWTQHVINKDEVRSKCFYPGTTHVYKPFNVSFNFENIGFPVTGRNQLVAEFQAFGANGQTRNTSVCVQITGTVEKV